MEREPRSPGKASEHDHALMERIQGGDAHALEILIQRYWDGLIRYAEGFTGSLDSAEDVAQETFVRVWSHRERWTARGSVRSYLFTITRNLCHHAKARRRTRTEWLRRQALDSQRSPSPEEVAAGRELSRALELAISDLPPRRREVFTLVSLQGLTYREAGEVMGIAVPTVANQMSAALSALRHALQSERQQRI